MDGVFVLIRNKRRVNLSMNSVDAAKTLTHLAAMVTERVSGKQAKLIGSFVHSYFDNVPSEDLVSRAEEDLYGAVLSHWNFAQKRKPKETKIRVLNPGMEEHGWQCERTVVEIVVDDTPFLVQSVIMAINRHNLSNHLVIHPVMTVERSRNGSITRLSAADYQSGVGLEAFLHIEVDRQSEKARLSELKTELEKIIEHVHAVTEDWQEIRSTIERAGKQLKARPPHGMTKEVDESLVFLDWLLQGHFVFLGCREYELVDDKKSKGFRIVENTGLGVLRDSIVPPPDSKVLPLSDDAWQVIIQKPPLLVTKATTRATVHRPVFMDYVGVRRFDKSGQVVGEIRFLGLYDSTAYSSSLEQIPLLKRRIQKIFSRSGFEPQSHSGRALMHVLHDMPRDELYHADEDSLYEYAVGVVQLQELQRVKLFVRQDVYGQFVSSLVFVPRERYHTDLRKQIQSILMSSFDGKSSEFKVQLSESVHARIHFIIHTGQCCNIEYDTKAIEQQIVDALLDWNDGLREALHSHFGEERGVKLFNRYCDDTSAAYREDFTARVAVLDIVHLENLSQSELQMRLYQPLESMENRLRFKLYNKGKPAPLSNSLPMLENMGVRVLEEKPYSLRQKETETRFWIHDFGLTYGGQIKLEIVSLKQVFEESFRQVWLGKIENDGFNKLVLEAHLDWRQITILRALFFYLRQIGMTFSQSYVENTLANNAQISVLLINLFETRFNPCVVKRQISFEKLAKTLEKSIDEVASLDEDRILRRYLNLIHAMLRTNYYQELCDEKDIPYLSFKFDPSKIDDLPAPRPYYEIFVYSPRMEGIHLRGGKVARGGLRWSDRKEDFRTEVLGLMKAQVTKNSVIIPTGAKGGFVAKQLSDDWRPEETRTEVVQCYQILIRGLLDITDNLAGDETVKPDNTVCYDEDDPYLVVAADKGTATFSDIANELAKSYKFWLGDAFASGGSVGYDHKKMGITARGAWESVKHHFMELGVKVQKETFTAIGIGDMSGDVFGNGMLQTQTIRLLSAFNHKHIFIDPEPDAKKAFKERQRLFKKPRSTWEDYDKKLISKGGGVYSRSAKSITLSLETRRALAIKAERLTPNQLIQEILCAPVDLLWNGGIGTYVKASSESNSDVGDRSNDGLRVDAGNLQCKVIGEGGNLGFTQKGRLEYSVDVGLINTDSIDNSAGVDCSDHEVNIKILLNRMVDNGDLTVKQRNLTLESMTDEVAQLVLRNNYLQTRAISNIQSESSQRMDLFKWVINLLEKQGGLNRSLESIPDDNVLNDRNNLSIGLLRPEIAVLLAYTKIMLKNVLLEENTIFDNEYSQQILLDYFPAILRKKYSGQVKNHRLRKEIIANQLINDMVNKLGIIFPLRIMDETGAPIGQVLKSFIVAVEIFDTRSFWSEIEDQDGLVDKEIQQSIFKDINKLVERTMLWLQSNARSDQSAEDCINAFRTNIKLVSKNLSTLLPDQHKIEVSQAVESLQAASVPKSLAERTSSLKGLFSCLDIVAVHIDCGRKLQEVATAYFSLDELFHWDWLRSQIGLLPQGTYWESLSRSALRDDFHKICQALTTCVVSEQETQTAGSMEQWSEQNCLMINRYLDLLGSIQRDSKIAMEHIAVLLKELRSIVTVKPTEQ